MPDEESSELRPELREEQNFIKSGEVLQGAGTACAKALYQAHKVREDKKGDQSGCEEGESTGDEAGEARIL